MNINYDFQPDAGSFWTCPSARLGVDVDGEPVLAPLPTPKDAHVGELWKRFDGFAKDAHDVDELVAELAKLLEYDGDLKSRVNNGFLVDPVKHIGQIEDHVFRDIDYASRTLSDFKKLDFQIFEYMRADEIQPETCEYRIVDDTGNLKPGYELIETDSRAWLFEYDIQEGRWCGLVKVEIKVTIDELTYSCTQVIRDSQIDHLRYRGSLDGIDFINCHTAGNLVDAINNVIGYQMLNSPATKENWEGFITQLTELDGKHELDEPLKAMRLDLSLRGLLAAELGSDTSVLYSYENGSWTFDSYSGQVHYWSGNAE